MFEDVVTRVTFGSLEEAYVKRIKQGTPVQWELETAQNHFVFLNSLQKIRLVGNETPGIKWGWRGDN